MTATLIEDRQRRARRAAILHAHLGEFIEDFEPSRENATSSIATYSADPSPPRFFAPSDVIAPLLPRTRSEPASFFCARDEVAARDRLWFSMPMTAGGQEHRVAGIPAAHALRVVARPRSVGRIRASKLGEIQGAFGLTTQALAAALNVSRAQLYKWLNPDNETALQEASVRRISTVLQLAQRWAKLTSLPLSAVAHEPLPDGNSIMTLLSGTEIDVEKLVTAMNILARSAEHREKSRTQRMSDAGYIRRPSHRSLPDA